jgi:hypothetical protein
MIDYDYYNREERAICAHLFRLLHEQLDQKRDSPFGQFIDMLAKSNLYFKGTEKTLENLRFDNINIFCEVSIIRDAYKNKKPNNINSFMDDLTRLIIKQENVNDCRLYSQLPEPLNNIRLTHPKQIRQKATSIGIQLKEGESRVYGAMQGMFNAKPDLVLTVDNFLLVCEAKHTKSFDDEQLKRTWNIAEAWATILYQDLGFTEVPNYTVFKLGGGKFNPHVNWTAIAEIAEKTYNEKDRTRIAIRAGVELLKRHSLE